MATKTKKTKDNSVSVSATLVSAAETEIVKTSEGKLNFLNSDVLSSVNTWIHTGSYKLDEIISRGRGLPASKIVTITGKKGSGKTTIVAHLIKEAQKVDALVVLFDTEYAFDLERAKKIGVDPNRILIGQPDHMEDLFGQLENVIKIAAESNRLAVIIWDSVAATPTRKEFEGTLGEGGHYGEHSKILSKGFRKITGLLSKNHILLFLVNQIKTNINAGLFQSDITYIGKNPLDFHSHVMLEIAQVSIVKENEIPIAITSRVKVSKNRVCPPFKETILRVNFENGLDTAWEALELGELYGRVRAKGAWKQIVVPCDYCLNIEILDEKGVTTLKSSGKLLDGSKCQNCEGSTQVIREGFKQFYAKDIASYLSEYAGLEEWLVYGTGPLALVS
jgi:recombination protein RecA